MVKKRILVVEDECITSMSIESNLVKAGYEVAAVVTKGEDAVRIAFELHPDLILMDISLEGHMSGIDAADEIRSACEDIPIVYMTAHTDSETIGRAKRTEPFGYLTKPLNMNTLMSTIEVALYKGEADAQRRKAEKALSERDELIKNILESIDEGFIIIDRDFRIISVNKAYANMVRMPIDDIIGRHCYEISHHSNKPCYENGSEHPCTVKQVFDTGEQSRSIHTHYDEKENPVYVETKAYPLSLDRKGKVTKAIEIVINITEKQKLEAQLRQAQKMEGIGQLAGGIAHDFNNILTAIIGYGNIALMKMAEDEPQRLNIEQMLDAADRAAHLTKDLLLFSRKQISESKPVDLNIVIKTVEKFLKRVIGEDVVYRSSLTNAAMTILGDAHQLEQVLMNLATNARDAMSMSGGDLTVTTEQVVFDKKFVKLHGYGKTGRYAMVTVSDTGKGMDEDTRQKIFEPFYTTKEAGKGTGLGLAVVYGIVKQHGGYINVYSEPGSGTTFRIYFPLIASEEAEEKVKVIEDRPEGGTETILVAEDEGPVRDITVTILREFGYNIITAVDGEEAVNKYREHKGDVHMLLFDLIMPKKSGKEAYDEIRKLKPDIKILFVSGYSPDVVRAKASLEDYTTILYKPLAPIALLKNVRSILDK
ncbi:MAG: response regulator [Nitrospirae bacterium]|nr:response regulator [Nitrospirota bacterium]